MFVLPKRLKEFNIESFCKTYIWLSLMLFVCTGPVGASFTKAKALEAINGYSLKMITDDGTRLVRLAGIICHSEGLKTFPCENKAKQFLQEITSGKELTLVFWATDAFGRRVCEVFLPDGTSLSELMVSQGYALQDQYYSSSAEISALEKTAKKNKLGVWKYFD